MKTAILSSLFLFNVTAFAGSLTGLDLTTSVDSALMQAQFEMDADQIVAWEATLDKGEILVSVVDTTDMTLLYGCHQHGPAVDCHEENHSQGTESFTKDPMATLAYMKEGYNAAVTRFTKTLKRRGLDFSAVESMKTWTTSEESGSDHAHSTDVWTKFHYEVNGSEKEIYVQCHMEAGETVFACHYFTAGVGEFEFDGIDHDHDHDHDEDHDEDHDHDHDHGHKH